MAGDELVAEGFSVVSRLNRELKQLREALHPDNRFVGETVIAELARTTVRVFAGAYDQEGFVVWSR